MQTISEYSEKFDAMVNKYLEPSLTHKYVLPVLALILILYVSHVRPTLPNFVLELFHNNIFRLVVCTYIVYRANHDPQSAVLIAAVFLIIMHMVNKQFIDKFTNNDIPNVSGCKTLNKTLGVNNNNVIKACDNLNSKIINLQNDAKTLGLPGANNGCVRNTNNVMTAIAPYRRVLNNEFCSKDANTTTCANLGPQLENLHTKLTLPQTCSQPTNKA